VGWIGELVYGFLRAFLPWMFSGQESHTTSEVVGLEDLDYSNLSGTENLSARDLPPLGVILALTLILCMSGCTLGGAKVQHATVFVEPGGVARIGTDKKLPIVAKDSAGADVYEERNVGGMVVMPVSVYRELRDNWEKRPVEKKPAEKE
jgi:hypothetical protein